MKAEQVRLPERTRWRLRYRQDREGYASRSELVRVIIERGLGTMEGDELLEYRRHQQEEGRKAREAASQGRRHVGQPPTDCDTCGLSGETELGDPLFRVNEIEHTATCNGCGAVTSY